MNFTLVLEHVESVLGWVGLSSKSVCFLVRQQYGDKSLRVNLAGGRGRGRGRGRDGPGRGGPGRGECVHREVMARLVPRLLCFYASE